MVVIVIVKQILFISTIKMQRKKTNNKMKKTFIFLTGGVIFFFLLFFVSLVVFGLLQMKNTEDDVIMAGSEEGDSNPKQVQFRILDNLNNEVGSKLEEDLTMTDRLYIDDTYKFEVKIPVEYLEDVAGSISNFQFDISIAKFPGEYGAFCETDADKLGYKLKDKAGWQINWGVLTDRIGLSTSDVKNGYLTKTIDISLSNFESDRTSKELINNFRYDSGWNFYNYQIDKFIFDDLDISYVFVVNLYGEDESGSFDLLRTGTMKECPEFDEKKRLERDEELRNIVNISRGNIFNRVDYTSKDKRNYHGQNIVWGVNICKSLNCEKNEDGSYQPCDSRCNPFEEDDKNLEGEPTIMNNEDFFVEILMNETIFPNPLFGFGNTGDLLVELGITEATETFCEEDEGQLLTNGVGIEEYILSQRGYPLTENDESNGWRVEWGVMTPRIQNNKEYDRPPIYNVLDYNSDPNIVTLKLNLSDYMNERQWIPQTCPNDNSSTTFCYDSGLQYYYNLIATNQYDPYQPGSYNLDSVSNPYFPSESGNDKYLLSINLFDATTGEMKYTGSLERREEEFQDCYINNKQNRNVIEDTMLNKFIEVKKFDMNMYYENGDFVSNPMLLDKNQNFHFELEVGEKIDIGAIQYSWAITPISNFDFCNLNDPYYPYIDNENIPDWKKIWGVLTDKVGDNLSGDLESRENIIRIPINFKDYSTFPDKYISKCGEENSISKYCYGSGLFFCSEVDDADDTNDTDDPNNPYDRYDVACSLEPNLVHLLAVNVHDDNGNLIYTGNPTSQELCGDNALRDEDLRMYIRYSKNFATSQ